MRDSLRLLFPLLGRRALLSVRLAFVARLGARRRGLFRLDGKEAVQPALLLGLKHLGEFGGSGADAILAVGSAQYRRAHLDVPR